MDRISLIRKVGCYSHENRNPLSNKIIVNKMWLKHLKYTIILPLAMLWVSCNFIDPEEYALRSADKIAGNMSYLANLHVAPYAYLPKGYNTIGNSWLAAASDDAEEENENELIQSFNFGNWNQYSNPDDQWTNNYAGIRKANDFMLFTDTLTWVQYKYSNPQEYTTRVYNTNMWRNEMFFLRAFFYFELIKRYGGVPLVKDKLDVQHDLDDIIKLKRNSFAECVDYIVEQCDTAAKYLLVTQTSSDYGKPTKGAALALKARTLLYAASDLFNRAGNTDPALGYTDANRKERWLRAAEACKDVLDMVPGTYALSSSYSGLFQLGSVISNKEIIFSRMMGTSNSFEAANYSIGFNGGKTGTCPTQNLVDAYEMKDGSSFNWSDPAQKADPYANRDPRLAMTVVYNNSTFNGRKMEIWEGGMDGAPLTRASKTGYYLSKYVVQNLDLTKSQTSYHQWIYFRLAEIYLDYAEAMNEALGPDDNGGYALSALDAVNTVRARPGVAMPAIPAGLSKDEFRIKLRNERRVELAFEGQRYWDVRRWGMGATYLGGDIKGVRVQKVTEDQYSYSPYLIETRTFSSQMDLYPIPQVEVVKSKGNVTQNPGW